LAYSLREGAAGQRAVRVSNRSCVRRRYEASTNARGVTAQPFYDASGNLLTDGVNQYLYDAEGRVCAAASTPIPGSTTVTGYLYDADGIRVAKGSLAGVSTLYTLSNGVLTPTTTCDPTANGFAITENYVLGPGGEELSMIGVVNGVNTWQRTNVYAGGKLIGTYDMAGGAPALHFHLEDPLGTRRMQLSGMAANLGQPEIDIASLPYGDQLTTTPDPNAAATSFDDATPLHFTGKERDTESGNDYFGARYYSSAMGRFLSPDWSAKAEPVPYAKLGNPQSLNLYAYVQNNPLTGVDPDGHYVGGGDLNTLAVWLRTGQMYAGQIATAQQEIQSDKSAAQQQNAPKPKLGEPGGRQLDPNGADCKDLAKKIDNLVADIAKRTTDISSNPLNLPQTAPPGSPLKDSVDGHQQIVKDRIDSLGQAATKYENMCGGGGPPAAPPVMSQSPNRVRNALAAGGAVLIVGAAIVLAPATGGLSLAAVAP